MIHRQADRRAAEAKAALEARAVAAGTTVGRLLHEDRRKEFAASKNLGARWDESPVRGPRATASGRPPTGLAAIRVDDAPTPPADTQICSSCGVPIAQSGRCGCS
jgi:hypothetical protein